MRYLFLQPYNEKEKSLRIPYEYRAEVRDGLAPLCDMAAVCR